MFKKVQDSGNISQVNKSTLKGVRNKLLEHFPIMENIIDDILPKKS